MQAPFILFMIFNTVKKIFLEICSCIRFISLHIQDFLPTNDLSYLVTLFKINPNKESARLRSH